MTTWTLALDESGRFEGDAVPGGSRERGALIVGGVLCPGAADELELPWRSAIAGCITAAAYPPHATTQRPEDRTRLRHIVVRELEAAGGLWIFVADTLPHDGRAERLATYVRMLAELVDMAGRIAARYGAARLDLRPAQRTVPLKPELAADARALGLAARDWAEDGTVAVRTLAEVETRQALDALNRDAIGWLTPWPVLASTQVVSAYSAQVHPGVVFADVGCHHLYTTLRDAPWISFDALWPALCTGTGNAPVFIARHGLRALRQVDRALRDIPSDLVRASRAAAALEGDVKGNVRSLSPFPAAREGTARLARALYGSAVSALAALPASKLTLVARQLAAQAASHLSVKTGDYEGTWQALSDGWCSAVPLAEKTRRAITDRHAAARLWRLTMQCANHRGDIASAEHARAECEAIFAKGLSFSLLSERLHVRTLANVHLQNRLPEAPDMEGLRLALEQEAQALVVAADEAGDVVALMAPQKVEWEMEVLYSATEIELWLRLAADRPKFMIPDHDRGKAFGTAARSAAFLGDLDRASGLALRARSHFADSPESLRFNAAVIARIEVERIRLRGGSVQSALAAALSLSGALDIRTPKAALDALRYDRGARFNLDILLRAIRWGALPSLLSLDVWVAALRKEGEDSYFGLSSRGEYRSHPTELIARHAAEILRAGGEVAAANRWFDLSIQLSEAGPENSTTRRFGPFTRRLADDPTFISDGAFGQMLNPSFEYR